MPNASNTTQFVADPDEILIKEKDGKFYILRDGQLIPQDSGASSALPRSAEAEELMQYAEKAETARRVATPSRSATADVVKIVLSEAGVTLADAYLETRLQSTLTTFFRDLRDRLETKEMLMKNTKVGGLGFDAETAERVLHAADRHQEEWGSVEPTKMEPSTPRSLREPGAPRPKPIVVRPQETSVTPQKKEESAPPAAQQGQPAPVVKKEREQKAPPPSNLPGAEQAIPKTPLSVTPRAAAPAPVAQVPKKTLHQDIIPPKKVQPAPSIVSKTPSGVSTTPLRPPSSPPAPAARVTPPPSLVSSIKKPSSGIPKSPQGRPLMTDVTPPVDRPRGALGELQYSLDAFRRLGNTEEAMKKVAQKIQSFFSDSWKQGMQALGMWRSSEIVKLMKAMSGESLRSGTPLATLAQTRAEAKKPTLTLEEWKAALLLDVQLEKLMMGGT